jgi:hypothetical protein
MAMLADDPVDRPSAGECAQLLTSAQFPAPGPGRPVRSRHLPGQVDGDTAEPDPLSGAAGEDPVTSPVTRPDAPRPAARLWRSGRAALTVAGLLLLLLAGSVTAWRLSAAPGAGGLAANGARTTAPASSAAAAAHPAAAGSASRPSSAAATPRGPTAAVAPTTFRSAVPASPRPASPAGSPSPSPTGSPSASSSASAPASSTPPLVPVPDVVGTTFAKARLLLVSDGFTVVGRHTRLGQIVTRTSPSAGEVPAGSLIIVVYGTGT